MLKQYLDLRTQDFMDRSYGKTRQHKEEILDEFREYLKGFGRNVDGKVIISYDIAISILNAALSNRIPLLLDKSDIVDGLDVDQDYAENKRTCFDKESDVILVHKLQYLPQQDTIKTFDSTKYQEFIQFVDPKTQISHKVPYVPGNDTIHFTLNCPVDNHMYGNDWDHYPYAVLVPFDRIDKATLLDTKTEDTYFDGDTYLGQLYYILCPKGEASYVGAHNPHARVIEYEGISLNKAIKALISYTGRKAKEYGAFGWGRDFEYFPQDRDEKTLFGLFDKEELPHLDTIHSESKYMTRRMWKREYRALMALLEYNNENNIDMPDEMIMPGLLFGRAYSVPGNVPVSIELYKEFVVPLLKENGYEVDEKFFEGIEEDGTIKSITSRYSVSYGCEIPEVYAPKWENELRNRSIDLIKKTLLKRKLKEEEIK